jgi:tetratricopeptide (TPR) repeat protein
VDQFVNVSEVVARAHTYLRIAESRLQTEAALPHDADSLYDHGVIELNRGQYATAKEMFERALQISPKAAHIHYGLASTFLRMEIKDLALQSLEQAINLDSYFRIRAQQDPDLALLREEPDFERIVFNDR